MLQIISFIYSKHYLNTNCLAYFPVYRVFSGGIERPRRDADHSPPSSAVVKKY